MSSTTGTPPGNALIITADPDLAETLRSELDAVGWRTVASNSLSPALRLLRKGGFGLLVVDADLAESAPERLNRSLASLTEGGAFLLVGEGPLRGMEPDAILQRPVDPAQLQSILQYVGNRRPTEPGVKILGISETMQEVRTMIAQIAPTPVSVLITGESGSGKDLVARSIHELSHRRSAPFLTVNCGAIPETLLESELFGHEKGAFTDAQARRQGIFEAADRGTVFLDEIAEMSLSAQVRLLRVLENREITRLGSTTSLPVDVRVIAATNRELQQAVAEGAFRHDLYYRLKVVEISVPPLRRRPEDLPGLVQLFVESYGEENGVPPISLEPGAMALLQRYNWPGNVRELKNLIERLMVLSVDRQISAAGLARYLENLDPQGSSRPDPTASLPVRLGKTPEESHRDLLYWAILEVARDVKELKAYLMNSRSEVQPLPVYPPEGSPLADQSTEVEYLESADSATEPGDVLPLRDVEKATIARALRATGGHRKRAARLLDMPERTLYRKIRQYGL